MKRLIIRHCRDTLVTPGYKWDVWCTNTQDPQADPVYVGYGSWHQCHDLVLWLLMAKQECPRFEFACFEQAMPSG